MNTVPHFYLTIESEVDKLLVLRKKINDQFSNNKISINDILIKSIALAQNKNPETNVSWFNGKIYHHMVHTIVRTMVHTHGSHHGSHPWFTPWFSTKVFTK